MGREAVDRDLYICDAGVIGALLQKPEEGIYRLERIREEDILPQGEINHRALLQAGRDAALEARVPEGMGSPFREVPVKGEHILI